MPTVLAIVNGRLLDPASGTDTTGDLLIVDGRFAERAPRGARVARYDAAGAWVLPGLLDLHVHFRAPGGAASETLATGARAASRGGFTRVVTMPNTRPPIDTPELVRHQVVAARRLPVDILPAACCTRERHGAEPADLPALRAAGAVAFTDDGAMVADDAVMEAVMRTAARLETVVMDHAVAPGLAAGGVVRAGALAQRLGLPTFPDEAETTAVARDIRLARRTGCRLHIQHISCAGALALLREARREGLPVTGEATPHHLMLAVEDIPGDDARWKMNPPLGTAADRSALRAAVLEGHVTCCATDHAPHAAALKQGGFRTSTFGVIGLETAVGASLRALVVESGMPPLAWAARWTTGPAEVLGLPHPRLRAGERADLCVVRPEDWTFGMADIVSRSANTPFLGWRLAGRTVATLRAGRFVWRSPH